MWRTGAPYPLSELFDVNALVICGSARCPGHYPTGKASTLSCYISP